MKLEKSWIVIMMLYIHMASRLNLSPDQPAESQIIYLQNSIFDPMTVPPLPWKGSYFGGHLLQHDLVVRMKSTSTQLDSIDKVDKENPGLSKVNTTS